jgi:hypothetical protein
MTGMTMVSSVSSPTPSTHPGFSQAIHSPYQSPFRAYPLPSSPLFGMPTTLMSGLQNFQHVEPETYIPSRVTPQALTNTSVAALRQQMDDSNHEMVNLLTTQIGTVFNPLIQNTNESYQMLAYQMSRIADFFGTPPPPRLNQPVRQTIMPAAPVAQINQG